MESRESPEKPIVTVPLVGAVVNDCVALHASPPEAPPEENAPAQPQHTAVPDTRVQVRKRGRPQKIPDELKEQAQALKDSGSNRDAAVILYGTQYPSPQQVKNVSTILREYRKKKSKQVAPSIQGAPKHRKLRG